MKWKFFLSPNATPWAATFAIGAAITKQERELAETRRILFGHNFDTDEYRYDLRIVNGHGDDSLYE